MRVAQRIIDLPGKRNVPPFKGGTPHYLMRGAPRVNAGQGLRSTRDPYSCGRDFAVFYARNMWKRDRRLLRGSHAIL